MKPRKPQVFKQYELKQTRINLIKKKAYFEAQTPGKIKKLKQASAKKLVT